MPTVQFYEQYGFAGESTPSEDSAVEPKETETPSEEPTTVVPEAPAPEVQPSSESETEDRESLVQKIEDEIEKLV